jgi:ABC-type glutathione transport system ATPase component
LRRSFGKGGDIGSDVPEGAAVRVTNLKKLYNTKTLGFIGRNKDVTAIEDLSFDVPKVSSCSLFDAELICRERFSVF